MVIIGNEEKIVLPVINKEGNKVSIAIGDKKINLAVRKPLKELSMLRQLGRRILDGLRVTPHVQFEIQVDESGESKTVEISLKDLQKAKLICIACFALSESASPLQSHVLNEIESWKTLKEDPTRSPVYEKKKVMVDRQLGLEALSLAGKSNKQVTSSGTLTVEVVLKDDRTVYLAGRQCQSSEKITLRPEVKKKYRKTVQSERQVLEAIPGYSGARKILKLKQGEINRSVNAALQTQLQLGGLYLEYNTNVRISPSKSNKKTSPAFTVDELHIKPTRKVNIFIPLKPEVRVGNEVVSQETKDQHLAHLTMTSLLKKVTAADIEGPEGLRAQIDGKIKELGEAGIHVTAESVEWVLERNDEKKLLAQISPKDVSDIEGYKTALEELKAGLVITSAEFGRGFNEEIEKLQEAGIHVTAESVEWVLERDATDSLVLRLTEDCERIIHNFHGMRLEVERQVAQLKNLGVLVSEDPMKLAFSRSAAGEMLATVSIGSMKWEVSRGERDWLATLSLDSITWEKFLNENEILYEDKTAILGYIKVLRGMWSGESIGKDQYSEEIDRQMRGLLMAGIAVSDQSVKCELSRNNKGDLVPTISPKGEDVVKGWEVMLAAMKIEGEEVPVVSHLQTEKPDLPDTEESIKSELNRTISRLYGTEKTEKAAALYKQHAAEAQFLKASFELMSWMQEKPLVGSVVHVEVLGASSGKMMPVVTMHGGTLLQRDPKTEYLKLDLVAQNESSPELLELELFEKAVSTAFSLAQCHEELSGDSDLCSVYAKAGVSLPGVTKEDVLRLESRLAALEPKEGVMDRELEVWKSCGALLKDVRRRIEARV